MPWTEEPDSLQFIGSQRAGQDRAMEHTETHNHEITELQRVFLGFMEGDVQE